MHMYNIFTMWWNFVWIQIESILQMTHRRYLRWYFLFFRQYIPFPYDKFLTQPNWKSLQTKISMLMKIAERFPNMSKTLLEKEKLLVTSNFSFSHNVFKSLVLQIRKNQGLFGKRLFEDLQGPLSPAVPLYHCTFKANAFFFMVVETPGYMVKDYEAEIILKDFL